jgi:3-oxoacyl-(acyl-carrier-protein) synthase
MNNVKLVITGIESVCAAGVGFEQLKQNLPGQPKVSSVKDYEFHQLDQQTPCFKAEFDPEAVLGKKGLRTKDWSTKLLLSAMEPLFKDQYVDVPQEEKPGISIGTAFGSLQSIGDFLSDSIVNGVNAVNPMQFANTVINSPTGNANIRYEVRSHSSTLATSFNAGIDAIIYACDHIRSGYLPAIVAGGLEEISYYGLLGLLRSGVLSRGGVMLPFGRSADGMVMGEGCAVLRIETEESARSRGAAIIAEIAGYSNAFDPEAPLSGYNPAGEGCRHTMLEACERAGITTSAIDFVASSANGTPGGDRMEADAIHAIFGNVPVTAYKSRLGETWGASGSLAVACTIADMQQKRITGLPQKYDTVGEANVVVGTTENIASEYALVNACSCDGNCASIVIRKRS